MMVEIYGEDVVWGELGTRDDLIKSDRNGKEVGLFLLKRI